jgi:hypothetical protein
MRYSITREAVPDDALLMTYLGAAHPERWGSYADCFSVKVDRSVTLAEFVFAFYTSPIFRIERSLLRVLINAPSSRSDARAVAEGTADKFAAWYVGRRTATQLLMCDRYERTRSWFCVEVLDGGGTCLRFGSAVAARRDPKSGAVTRGAGFGLLLGFHVAYSRALLHAARMNLRRVAASR